MKTVILCGGLGTRLSEETVVKPKPMVEIGGRPILWHIMKTYDHHGFRDFVLALGYKGEVIKSFFINYYTYANDATVHLGSGRVDWTDNGTEDWMVSLIDTGLKTMTGGRLKRLSSILEPRESFMLTYGDGVADIDIEALVRFHRSHGKLATVTAVRPAARFGRMIFDGDQVVDFKEKPQTEEGWINGGFFVFEPGVLDYLEGDETILEAAPLESLARDGQLMAYRHQGFWHCMDTLRDRNALEELWATKQAQWKVWR
ncbi:MAG: glucose-1-phosphate cytidylyltransferase [Proteobacteria bacterium]|nr:glucose-1-phosphate cytidylyltransferase [Pseudomonadota bacterium]